MSYNYFNLDISSSLKFCGTYDATHSYSTGDVCIYDGCTYVNIGNTWECISISGYETKILKITYPTNCKNCGAILHNHICEYCGSDNSI